MNGSVHRNRGLEFMHRPRMDDITAFSRSLEAFMRVSLGRVRNRSVTVAAEEIEHVPEPEPARMTIGEVVQIASPKVRIRLADFLPGNRRCKITS